VSEAVWNLGGKRRKRHACCCGALSNSKHTINLQPFRTCVLQEGLIEITAHETCNVPTFKNQLERIKIHPFFEHVFERLVNVRAGLRLVFGFCNMEETVLVF
jgi:hypothetical protein